VCCDEGRFLGRVALFFFWGGGVSGEHTSASLVMNVDKEQRYHSNGDMLSTAYSEYKVKRKKKDLVLLGGGDLAHESSMLVLTNVDIGIDLGDALVLRLDVLELGSLLDLAQEITVLVLSDVDISINLRGALVRRLDVLELRSLRHSRKNLVHIAC
jgi:hypothetical protein